MKQFLIILLCAGLTINATAQQKKVTPKQVINKSEAQEANRLRKTFEQQQLNAAPELLEKVESKGRKTKNKKMKNKK